MSIPSSASNASDPLAPAAYSQQEVFELAKTDMDFLAGVALPTVTEYAFPPVYLELWKLLLDLVYRTRDFSKVAVGLPRGFGKTSVIKLLVLYVILYTRKSFILILGNTAGLAENILADIADMLDEPNIKAVYGDWRLGLEQDTQPLKKFGFRGRNIVLAALGQGGSVRGLNIKNQRPDIMIFDDIQSRVDAESQVLSQKIKTWMFGTAMKAASHKGCTFIFVANMYPTKYSLLRGLKTNNSWIKFIAGGILADGTSLWEELKPIKQLIEEYQNDRDSGHPELFYSEVLNDENASVNPNIDLSRLPTYPYTPEDIHAGCFIVIDPSNDKPNSDAVAIGLFIILEGLPVVREILEGRFSPGDTIKETLKLAVKWNCTLIVIEGNAYQYSLCYWFKYFQDLMGMYYIQAVPIYSGSRAKNSRILDMFKTLLAGEMYIHPDCLSQVAYQIIHFNSLKTNNVDGVLDLLTYAPRVLTEFPHFIALNNPLSSINNNSPGVASIEETCCF